MYRSLLTTAGGLLLAILLCGCVSIADINAGYYRIGKAWQLDNQRAEDEYRYRIIEADLLPAFEATRKTFLSLGMPVQSSNLESGVLFAENLAPAPLSQEEWLEVKRIETPRLKELGGTLFSFPDVPKDYRITVKATLRPLKDNKVLVIVDYLMDSPAWRQAGVLVTPHAPPTAVKFGSAKFWKQLEQELRSKNLPTPRKRRWDEES
jgi:hypothetical protein